MFNADRSAQKRTRTRRMMAATAGLLFGAAGLLTAPAFAADHTGGTGACAPNYGSSYFYESDATHINIHSVFIGLDPAAKGDTYIVKAGPTWTHTGTVNARSDIDFTLTDAESAQAALVYTGEIDFNYTLSAAAKTVCSGTITMTEPKPTATTSTSIKATTSTTVKATTTSTTEVPVTTSTTEVPVTTIPTSTTSTTEPSTTSTTEVPVTTSTTEVPVTTSTTVPATTTTSVAPGATTSTTSTTVATTSTTEAPTTTTSTPVTPVTTSTNTQTSVLAETIASANTDNTATSTGALAFTGSNVGPMVGLGLALVGIGFAMVWVAMYRKDRAERVRF